MGVISFVKGAGLGAGMMYLFDPDLGNRRRALLRDKAVHIVNEIGDAVDTAARDFSNRAYGLVAEVRSMLSNEPVSDAVLEARVRSKMGHVVSHPGAIEVTANCGRVTLHGPILAGEAEALLACVELVPGVLAVENQLEVHASADHISALQGGEPRCNRPADWTPTTRLLLAVGGGILALYGSRRGGLLGMAASAAGASLVVRGVNGPHNGRLPISMTGQRSSDMQKTRLESDNARRDTTAEHQRRDEESFAR